MRRILSALAGFATAIALTMALLWLLWWVGRWAGAHEVTGFWLVFTLAAFFVAGLVGGRIALWIHPGGVLPVVALCVLLGVLRLLTGKGLELLGLFLFLLLAGGVFVGGRRTPPASETGPSAAP